MSKKNQTIKGKEKQIPERELIGGEFYLIDEKKSLNASTQDDGIYYNAEGKGLFSRQNPRSADDNSAWPGPPIAFTRSNKMSGVSLERTGDTSYDFSTP